MNAIKQPLINRIYLWVTEECNLKCPYCFVKPHIKKVPASKALKVFELIKNNRNLFADDITITFTGGEPLLKFDYIKQWVSDYNVRQGSLSFKLQFNIFTNGILLKDDTINFFYKNRFTIILGDGGVFGTDIPQAKNSLKQKLLLIKKMSIPIRAGLVVSPHSLNLVDRVRFLIELGFENIDLYNKINESWENRRPSLDKALTELAHFCWKEAKSKNLLPLSLFYRYFARYISNKRKPTADKLTPCSAGKSFISVSIDGSILPCHFQYPNNKELSVSIGDLRQGIDYQKHSGFLEYSSCVKHPCKNCAARFICGGPCYAEEILQKDSTTPFSGRCIFMKKLTPLVKYLYYNCFINDYRLLDELINKYYSQHTCCS